MAHARSARRSRFRPDLPLILTIALIVLLWVAGGASRADTMGQVIVRAGCWAILIAAILAGPRPIFAGARPVLFLLIATIALPLIQLIPLPPAPCLVAIAARSRHSADSRGAGAVAAMDDDAGRDAKRAGIAHRAGGDAAGAGAGE